MPHITRPRPTATAACRAAGEKTACSYLVVSTLAALARHAPALMPSIAHLAASSLILANYSTHIYTSTLACFNTISPGSSTQLSEDARRDALLASSIKHRRHQGMLPPGPGPAPCQVRPRPQHALAEGDGSRIAFSARLPCHGAASLEHVSAWGSNLRHHFRAGAPDRPIRALACRHLLAALALPVLDRSQKTPPRCLPNIKR